MGGHGGSGGSFGGGGSNSRKPSYDRCTQQNSLLKTDGSQVKVEYYLSAITRGYDMTKAIIKFDPNYYLSEPGCIKILTVVGRPDPTIEDQYQYRSQGGYRRSKRTIGELPGQRRGS